ncbi:ABC transporter substrate-binding protein [Vibrio sp. SCSIO 43136]|uniref:ABC transporter substrate-binding protein n=1 Tax=Vibrio sp. SCSIO 43136 TaxID=2819101 RepID=UPI0020763805|nr:ABC transporter substrate-binding protein [Vibrio sp. SCSIO 43136]USD68008.1 ABC transporter substrate-binding protein [Vibrio sp. SCSIO 43136]
MKLVALLAIVSLLFGCTPSNSPLTFSSHVWPGYEFIFLSKNLGRVDPSLLDITNTGSATESIRLLKQNRVESAALTLDEVLLARAQGIDLTIIAVVDISAGADIVVSRQSISDLSELKGKRVGVERTAVGTLVLHQLLGKANLSNSDITVVDVTIDTQLSAWNEHQVDVLVTYQPVANQVIKQGGKVIFDSRSMPNMIFDVLAVKTSSLGKTKQIKHLLQSHYDGLQHFHLQREDSLYRLADRLQVPPEQVLSLYQGIVLPQRENSKELMKSGGKVQQTAHLLNFLLSDSGHLDTPVSLEHLVNNEYLPYD